jgi:heme a synthase
MNALPAVDFAPALRMLALATLLAALPLAGWWWRHRRAGARVRLVGLSALALFLTADLIVFGSFTRLTDSGLGCPDWPGCYGAASPLGASAHIQAAEQAQPEGPVTVTKAWIEMIHRYLAMTVGVLIIVLAIALWRTRALAGHTPRWALAALVWVVIQGLFGKYTVTLKLYPAVVTAHLLGGLVLLALLVAQFETLRKAGSIAAPGWFGWALVLVTAQIALGGWVSTNYAVLACRGFPQCNGQWWPSMDFAQGFTLLRELGQGAGGAYVDFPALVAIHMAHRLFAIAVLLAVSVLAVRLWRRGQTQARRHAAVLCLLLLVQLVSGLSNVVLDWPMLAALMHTAGAAGLVGVLVSLWMRGRARSTATATHASGPALERGGAEPARKAPEGDLRRVRRTGGNTSRWAESSP